MPHHQVVSAAFSQSTRLAPSLELVALRRLGVTPQIVADRLGVSAGSAGHLMLGHRPTPAEHLPALRELLREAIEDATYLVGEACARGDPGLDSMRERLRHAQAVLHLVTGEVGS
jgi:hypothetical protein